MLVCEPPRCTRCRVRPRVAGQRWCQQCRTTWQRTQRGVPQSSETTRREPFSPSPDSPAAKVIILRPCRVCGIVERVEAYRELPKKPLAMLGYCSAHRAEYLRQRRLARIAAELPDPQREIVDSGKPPQETNFEGF